MDILLVSLDGGGNVPPMRGLGAELARRRHRVGHLALPTDAAPASIAAMGSGAANGADVVEAIAVGLR